MELILLMAVVWWLTRKIDDKGHFHWNEPNKGLDRSVYHPFWDDRPTAPCCR